MLKKLDKLFGITIVLLTLLLIIPSSLAVNENDIYADDNLDVKISENTELSISNDDAALLGVDYYFDSSTNESGDGSIDNPYYELTLDNLKDSSIIHLSNGEYSLNDGKTLNKVTIIGENPDKTIIKYTGSSSSGLFKINADNYLVLRNITLIGFNFDLNGGNIRATNTIFKNAVASSQDYPKINILNSSVNSFGGVIHAYEYSKSRTTSFPSVVIENCTFINNTAEYGGAIFIKSGKLNISDSNFINNQAYNYGGALVGYTDSSIYIKRTKFINDSSIDDAGGAIYLFESYLSARDVNVINCTSTFGGAITAFNTTTHLEDLKAINNVAKYEGGAVYQMYGNLTVTNSDFINNAARNGGAVYVDDVSIFKLTYNNFNDNKASMVAGAVYSLLVGTSTINDNNYIRNKASFYDDFYQTREIGMFIGNGNYTLIFNDNNTYEGKLPSYYNLLDYNYVTSVKDQLEGGNCWAFASIATLESAILKASGLNLDLSEEHMKNIAEMYSDYGWLIETNNGGYSNMAIGYLTSWLGPVMDYYDEYDDYSVVSPILNSFTHVQNVVFISRNKYTDNKAIKEAIMKYGAVQTEFYYNDNYFSSSKNSYYYQGVNGNNHVVTIVGWDDNYSRNNFLYKPSGNGAWIVKNSWGSDWGKDGYFYVSYYDSRFAKIKDPEACYAFVFNDSQRYDKNYQYDLIGETDYLVSTKYDVWVQNIFESTDNELLAAVSTYVRKTTEFELYIYVNDELATTQNGILNPGYTTIQLNKFVPLSLGDKFKVMFKLSRDGVEFAISEKIKATRLTYGQGVSFFSYDGKNWIDLSNYKASTYVDGGHTYNSQIAAIKAFTILNELEPSINLTVLNIYNKADILAVIHDQYGNVIRSGEVVFNIENNNYTVKVENSIANFTHVFKSIGNHEINVFYKNYNRNINIYISKINIDLDSTIIVDRNNVNINLFTPLKINSTINLLINDKVWPVNLISGAGSLRLINLENGVYNISVNDDNYVSGFTSSFFIRVVKTNLIANDLISYNSFENSYSVVLKDDNENPVVNRQVTFISDGKSYFSNTDDNGVASTILKVKNKNYKINVLFDGDDTYFESNATVNGEVRSSISFLNSNYLVKSQYEAILMDTYGNPLIKNQVNVVIDNKDYSVSTDNNGKLSLNLNLKTGSHIVTVKNPKTEEILSQTINVVSKIMENKNMDVYYLSGSVYKIRIYGDNAIPVGANKEVKVVVNKKTHVIKTNGEGYASFKLDNLKPGSYTLTATYGGVEVSNKIVIKPVLITNDLTKKKAKTVKFSAKLLDSKGKVAKNKKITFKIKGKTYTAKTNTKGIATISIKDLKVGKYTVTTIYGKSTNKNIIKIKK